MISIRTYIKNFDWIVHFHFAVSRYHTDEIVKELESLGCSSDHIREASALMDSGDLDTGLTFSDSGARESVVVTALTSSAAEFQDSLQHELRHLVDNICSTDKIRYGAEKSAYLVGDLNRELFPYVRHLLCDDCRGKKQIL